MVLVDTSVWVDYLRGIRCAETMHVRRAATLDEGVCTCGVILTEVLRGVRSAREHDEALSTLDELIYLPLPKSAYVRAADIYRAARARGKTIRSTVDCIIAACAIVHDVPLIQKDRDFETIASVSGLQLVRA